MIDAGSVSITVVEYAAGGSLIALLLGIVGWGAVRWVKSTDSLATKMDNLGASMASLQLVIAEKYVTKEDAAKLSQDIEQKFKTTHQFHLAVYHGENPE